jgi:hypothetical protein
MRKILLILHSPDRARPNRIYPLCEGRDFARIHKIAFTAVRLAVSRLLQNRTTARFEAQIAIRAALDFNP